MPPLFLELDDILELHRDQIERYGGAAGVRVFASLASALAVPQAGTAEGEYFQEGLFEMAAAYLFSIVKNHPFVDGNKRAGALAAFAFLRLNGADLAAPERSFENLVRSVAEGKADKAAVTAFFRKHGREGRT